MIRFAFPLAVVAVAFYIFSIVDVVLTPAERVRAFKKWIWIILVVLLFVVGGALWFILGKERRSSGGRSGEPRTVAPDDDPSFLEQLDRDEERDARIRELEEQLAELDDDDDPRK
jgi:hypothetical protein